MSFDYREFKKFYEGMVKAYSDLEDFLIDFLLEEARWLEGETKDHTPVDTGNLRRRWRITKVYKLSSGNLGFVLINDADYASYVEDGHTNRNREGWVEGYYMATISIQKLQSRMPADFDMEFRLFLRKHGVL